MTAVTDLLQSLIELDVDREAKAAIGRTKSAILDLNREQLLHGMRADKTQMPDYSYLSVTLFGKTPGPIVLYDTGAFQSSFQLDVDASEFEILADDVHGLEERYGEEIYGLTPSSQEYYNQEIYFPELIRAVEELTGLNTDN